jgi:hypothetical protein
LASPFSERCVFLQGVTRRFSDRFLAKRLDGYKELVTEYNEAIKETVEAKDD